MNSVHSALSREANQILKQVPRFIFQHLPKSTQRLPQTFAPDKKKIHSGQDKYLS